MILAAGFGSRLHPLTRSIPKPLVPIVGKPVMVHLIDLLKRHDITEIMVNVQYLGDKIKEAIGDGSAYGVRIHYSEEEELCGDAGGVKRCESFFRDSEDDTFLVVGGDDLTDMDLSRVVAEHKAKKAMATLAVTPVEETSEYGIVVVNEEGYITRFQEKPKRGEAFSNLANTGIYVFNTRVFDFIPPDTFYGFGNDVFPALMSAQEPVSAVTCEAYWKDVGNLAIYQQAQRDCIDGRCKVMFPAPMREEKTWIGNHVQIARDAYVETPVVIANNCRIGAHAHIGGYSVLGNGCVVEAGATIVDSILWPGAVVKAGTYLEKCVVGIQAEVSSSVGIFYGLIVDPRSPDAGPSR